MGQDAVGFLVFLLLNKTDNLSKASLSNFHNAILVFSRRNSPRTIGSWCKLWIQWLPQALGIIGKIESMKCRKQVLEKVSKEEVLEAM